jgi:hypothetical protein
MATRASKKQIVMATKLVWVTLLVVLAVIAGCRRDGLVHPPNELPAAVARITMVNGQPAEGFLMGEELKVPFDGTNPVQVTLDGSQSTDKDGTIATFRWFSGTLDADGKGRRVPEGQDATWPPDEMSPTVTVGEGVWTFSLWVVDDGGATSEPATVTITVGEPMEPDAGSMGGGATVAECVMNVVPDVPEACRMCICDIDDACRMNVVQTACDAACWALISCVGANCPDFAMMAMAGDYSCLTGNCMAQLTAAMGGSTPMGATPAGACARMCPDECAAM